MDPLTPARAALRLPVEHEHRPSLPRAGLPRSRHPSLVTIPSPSTTWPTSLLWHATPQPNVRTGVPVSDFAFDRQARRSTKPNRVRFLRTGSPPLIALHPASWRRSYHWFQAGERMPGEDLHLSGWVRLEAHRSACTAGRAVRRANRKRTTEPRSSGRSFAVGTPRPPLRGAASSALPAACSSLCLCVSVAEYVVIFLKWGTDRRHDIRRRNCELEYLSAHGDTRRLLSTLGF